jgi:hypothetical protein
VLTLPPHSDAFAVIVRVEFWPRWTVVGDAETLIVGLPVGFTVNEVFAVLVTPPDSTVNTTSWLPLSPVVGTLAVAPVALIGAPFSVQR